MARFRVGRGAVGLDIGTSAVRAVEIRGGSPPTVTQIGQVLLPTGALRGGEIEDVGAVAQACAALWKRGGFRSRAVRLGVANQRVVTRILEFPAMPRQEIEGAIRLHAGDQIPIPLADAVIDFEVVDEMPGPEGQPLMHVFVAAAQRHMVDQVIAVADEAKLEPAVLELNAYPLVRSLGAVESVLSNEAEAIVDIGAAVTQVVVHHAGRIRFLRIVSSGGDDLTQRLVDSMSLTWEAAEALKIRCGPALLARVAPFAEAAETAPDEETARAAEELAPRLRALVDELRVSLTFYGHQFPELPVGGVTLAGGGSLLGGLRESVMGAVRLPAEPGAPLARVRVGSVKLTPAQVAQAEPFLAVAVGLGLGAFEE